MPAKGYGSIYVLQKGKQKWVCNINGFTRKVIHLQPGNYRVIWRTALAKRMNLSQIKSFKIISGRSVSIKF